MRKETEFYERQEQREEDKLEIKDGFCFMDKETYDTRWLEKSVNQQRIIPSYQRSVRENNFEEKPRDVNGSNAQVKNSEGTLKAKGYDLNQVETGRAKVGEDLRRLLENLADDKPVVRNNDKDKPKVTILRKNEAAYGSLKKKQLDDKETICSHYLRKSRTRY